MNNELLSVSDFLSILEIFLTLIVAFVGAAVHEYVFTPGETKLIKNAHVWATVSVDFIICYSINPYIVSLNPRLILLPPLIIGLLGNELAIRMGTIKGSTSMIEYILGWFNIKRNTTEDETTGVIDEPGIIHEEHKKQYHESHKEDDQAINLDAQTIVVDDNIQNNIEKFYTNKEISLQTDLDNMDNIVHFTLNEVSDILIEYYSTKNAKEFLTNYYSMKLKIKNIIQSMTSYRFIPITTSIKYAEILKKEIEMDSIYNKITQTVMDDNMCNEP